MRILSPSQRVPTVPSLHHVDSATSGRLASEGKRTGPPRRRPRRHSHCQTTWRASPIGKTIKQTERMPWQARQPGTAIKSKDPRRLQGAARSGFAGSLQQRKFLKAATFWLKQQSEELSREIVRFRVTRKNLSCSDINKVTHILQNQ